MEDNHDKFVQLAKAKHEADDYRHSVVSPEVERIARFFWWIVGGLLVGAVGVTIWVTNMNGSIVGFEKRITAIEATDSAYSATASAQILAEASQNSLIKSIQDTQAEWKEEIKKVEEMWQIKIRGESFRDVFFREHGYAAPSAPTDQPSPIPHR